MGSLAMSDAPTAPTPPTYARPLDEVRLEPNPKRIRARAGGRTIADSRSTMLLLGARHLPVYCFPRDDVATNLLEPRGPDEDPGLGELERYDLNLEDRLAEAAAWEVTAPADEAPDLTGYIQFEWDAVDTWLEEDERVHGHPPHPYHRCDIRQSSRHVQVHVAGEQVADSTRPVLLFETGLPTRYYLQREDVAMELLEPSDTLTTCAYKGQAEHLHAVTDQGRAEDVAWCYPAPFPGFEKIQDLVCFYQERIDRLVVDGVEHEPPVTHWS